VDGQIGREKHYTKKDRKAGEGTSRQRDTVTERQINRQVDGQIDSEKQTQKEL